MPRLIDSSQFSAAQSNPNLERLLPELIDRLIRSTAGHGNYQELRIPHGENYKVHGLDGHVTLLGKCRDIPAGKTVIEIGATESRTALRDKAESEFNRVAQRLGDQVSDHVFVMVGRADWDGMVTKKNNKGVVIESYRWLDRKRALRDEKEATFRDVVLIDQEALINWINDDLETTLWFLEELGHSAKFAGQGVHTLEDRIKDYFSRFQMPVDPNILTDEQPDLSRLAIDIVSSTQPISVYANSDIEASVAVCHLLNGKDELADQPKICVSSRAGVELLAACNIPHIVVLENEAALHSNRLRNHNVIVAKALLSDPARNPSVFLRRPSIETFARNIDAATQLGNAETISRAMGRTMTALERNYGSLEGNRAPWSDPADGDSDLLLLLSVIGSWNTAQVWDKDADSYRPQFKDTKLLLELTGEPNDDRIIRMLEKYGREVGRDFGACDPMFAHADSVVAINAPIDAFYRFAHRYRDRHYDILEKGLKTIFDSRSNKMRPRDEMYDPAKETGYSDDILGGLILTFVLVGLFGDQRPLNLKPRGGECRNYCDDVYLNRLPQLSENPLLSGTISSWLPLLAEGCPHAFLRSLETLLEGHNDVVKEIFRVREHSYGFGNYHIGNSILWALERLAWVEEYVPRISNILFGLHLSAGKIDSNVGNQPLASLRGILSLYIPQSTASPETRLQTFKMLSDTYGKDALDLFVELLDSRGGGSIISTSKPIFTWVDEPTRMWADIYDERDALMEISVKLAANSSSTLARLVDTVPLMEPKIFRQYIDLIKSTKSNREGNLLLLDELRDFTSRHAEFPDADWSVSSDRVLALKKSMDVIRPTDITRHLWLFENSWVRLPDSSRMDSHNELPQKRVGVMQDLVTAPETSLFEFISKAGAPYPIGVALATYLQNPENTICHAMLAKLNLKEEKSRPFIIGLSDGVSRENPEGWLALLNEVHLKVPANCLEWIGTGLFPSSYILSEMIGAKYSSFIHKGFWESVDIYSLFRVEMPDGVIQELLNAGRAHDLAALAHKADTSLNDDDIRKIAEAFLPDLAKSISNGNARDQMSTYYFWGMLETVETRGIMSLEEIAKIEFPMARSFQFNGPKRLTALHRVMAKSPKDYVELLSYVFRADPEQTKADPKAIAKVESPSDGVAESAYAALSSMNNLPGESGGKFDYQKLEAWALEVIEMAEAIGRREIAWSQIGELFGRATVDPQDGTWPDRAVRDFIEKQGNARFREAVRRGEFNNRGVRVGPTEIHSEESSKKFDAWAKELSAWPKTQNILRDIASNDRKWAQNALTDKMNDDVRSGLR